MGILQKPACVGTRLGWILVDSLLRASLARQLTRPVKIVPEVRMEVFVVLARMSAHVVMQRI
eukprot:3775806-Amphidinium_carterae.1